MSFDEKWNTHLYAGKRKCRAVWQWIELHLTDIHSTKTDKIWIRSMKIKMNRIWKFWQNSLAYFFYCLLALWLCFSFLSFFFISLLARPYLSTVLFFETEPALVKFELWTLTVFMIFIVFQRLSRNFLMTVCILTRISLADHAKKFLVPGP